MLLQTKEYIQNYGIYFTRKSMERYSAFSLKCEQGQVEYPSIHHLLDLNSNYSSLRLASLILPVLEQIPCCSKLHICLPSKPLDSEVQWHLSGPASVLILTCPVVMRVMVQGTARPSSVHLLWLSPEAQMKEEIFIHCCESACNFIICKRDFFPPPTVILSFFFSCSLTGIIIFNTFAF